MKKLLGIFGLCSLCLAGTAQSNATKTAQENNSGTEMSKRDCVMMRDSMLMIVRHGQTRMMDNSLKLNNGTTILINGLLRMADGSTRVFREGQYIDMDGNIGMIDNWFKKPRIE